MTEWESMGIGSYEVRPLRDSGQIEIGKDFTERNSQDSGEQEPVYRLFTKVES
jgi:hypothetical protein